MRSAIATRRGLKILELSTEISPKFSQTEVQLAVLDGQ